MNGGLISRKTLLKAGRRLGASPEARQAMAEADKKATWFGNCRHCGETITGDLVSLMQHKCADPELEADDGDASEEDPDNIGGRGLPGNTSFDESTLPRAHRNSQ